MLNQSNNAVFWETNQWVRDRTILSTDYETMGQTQLFKHERAHTDPHAVAVPAGTVSILMQWQRLKEPTSGRSIVWLTIIIPIRIGVIDVLAGQTVIISTVWYNNQLREYRRPRKLTTVLLLTHLMIKATVSKQHGSYQGTASRMVDLPKLVTRYLIDEEEARMRVLSQPAESSEQEPYKYMTWMTRDRWTPARTL